MQKTALYRKYRPLTFSEVYGQDHITLPLRRQIASEAIGHAYLFTGTRGTGKTTCAKIFSRAINCLNPKDGEPCNECSVCKGILDGSIFDVYEIDAASNTGVENIRDIRDDIAYAPITAKYKVYIIDEVHMLSTGAFNALLKTLEEPPEHVVFILATTEPHKVPATILSRCQRFDFFRLNIKTLTAVLESVLAREGKVLNKDSISLVADIADGSVRDSLSILDRVLELDSPEQIERSLGVIGKSKLYNTVRHIANADTTALYSLVGEMYSASADMGVFAEELAEVFRRILAAKSATEPEKVIDVSDDELQKIKELCPLFSEQYLIYAIKMLRQVRQAISKGTDARAEVEVCLLMLAKPSLSEDAAALTARIEVLENKVESLANGSMRNVVPSPKPEYPKEDAAVSRVLKQESPIEDTSVKTKTKGTAQTTESSDGYHKEETPVSRVSKQESPIEDTSVKTKTEDTAQTTENSDAWREYQTLDEIALRIKDMSTQMLLRYYSKAVYRNKEIVIITAKQTDVDALKKNIEQIRAAFEADHKTGRIITVERGDDTAKYVGSTYAYDNIETNPMFKIE